MMIIKIYNNTNKNIQKTEQKYNIIFFLYKNLKFIFNKNID